MIKAQIHIEGLAKLNNQTETEVKTLTKKYANDLRYDFDFQTYTVYFEDDNWLMANIAMPGLDQILRQIP